MYGKSMPSGQTFFTNGQKRGPLKSSDLFRILIVAFSISFFIFQLKFFDSYKKIFKNFSLD